MVYLFKSAHEKILIVSDFQIFRMLFISNVNYLNLSFIMLSRELHFIDKECIKKILLAV